MIRILLGFGCLLVCFGLLFTNGCQNSGAYTASEKDSLQFEELWDDTSGIARENVAICVWPVVGLRREPGRKVYTTGPNQQENYLVPIYYGESVEMLNELDTVPSENRVYMKIRLQDGEEGWVYEELFEKSGRLAVMTSTSELYRRPDMMTLRDEGLDIGEIVVVLERKDNWLHISGNKKTKKGWIREAGKFSMEQTDLKVALLLFKAEQADAADQKREKLEAILSDASLSNSELIPLVKSVLQEMDNNSSSSRPDSSVRNSESE